MNRWQVWIDTGGTFTDCMALDPEGALHKTKVLSNGSLRGKAVEWIDSQTLRIEQSWDAPSDFIKGFKFRLLDTEFEPVEVAFFDPGQSILRLVGGWPGKPDDHRSFEVISNEEAPVLAARLVTKCLPAEPTPQMDLRLATTKGTNALLEQKGAPILLFITKGFGDLLKIGNQKRPDLFSLEVHKPEPLYKQMIEVDERLDAKGEALNELNLNALQKAIRLIKHPEQYAVAVCLMHGYKNSVHEEVLAGHLTQAGFKYISISSRLAPFIKILPRAQTTLVNAYLSPILEEYLASVRQVISEGSLRVMTSAGGLVKAGRFNPKDSLLSGPAGGVVGAAAIGKQVGFKNIISFDMGGTSTDVARYDKGFDYIFEHAVGEATLAAPALSIETVAAGGGSVCSFDGFKLTVGPGSAGADPGPACYGAGGPLTLTDVNLLLGRLEPDNFGIPVSKKAAEKKFREILSKIRKKKDEEIRSQEILEGFLRIANERMADTIRKISLRKGYDPREYALVAFGGAGAQHACAIANQLNMGNIIIPSDAGLLSAYGLGYAVIEQFAERQILQPLPEIETGLSSAFDELKEQAVQKLRDEGLDPGNINIRRQLVYMRLQGQESTLEVAFNPGDNLKKSFEVTYRKRYGHWISGRDIEVESIRVVASGRPRKGLPSKSETTKIKGEPVRTKKIIFNGKKLETPVFIRRDLAKGQQVGGPALILDPYSTIVVEPGWNMAVLADSSLLVQAGSAKTAEKNSRSDAVGLELFTNRFTSIAGEMGEMLRRTALSVNVKERMDFSCALLNGGGELIVNAPHIPVHLGALGLCIRRIKETIEMKPGDVVVANHPAFGGSHLPDVTVVTPIFTGDNDLIGFAASRAHHAEIGGARPGSMPPDAITLAEEGVVIPPMYLIEKGNEQWDKIRHVLASATYPTRSIEENIPDLQAAVAANHRGATSLLHLVEKHGKAQVLHYMKALKQHAADKIRSTIQQIPNGEYTAEEQLDDGTLLKVKISVTGRKITFDFEGTGDVHPGNLNATPAIVNSVVMYVLRLLIDESLPLNEGLLDPVTIKLPDCLLNPEFPEDPEKCPAVVGGNVETSQRLADLLLKPFEKIACSQGTMNNVLFGNDSFGYYETIGGGTGAGPGFNGADAVHHHMTNTAGTDPEILEQRYPVRLDRYAIRPHSGGKGKYGGGNGIIREMTFLEPLILSVLTQHRVQAPYGLKGGEPGAKGKQWVIRKDGTEETLKSIDGRELEAGDRLVLLTPGGGGFGGVE